MNVSMDQTAEIEKHTEGPLARAIEEQTARLPSDTFLWAAMGSLGLSLGLQLSGRKAASQFVGQWVPTFLIFGLYNKIVKVAGHDRAAPPRNGNPNQEGSRGAKAAHDSDQSKRKDIPRAEQPAQGLRIGGTSPSREVQPPPSPQNPGKPVK